MLRVTSPRPIPKKLWAQALHATRTLGYAGLPQQTLTAVLELSNNSSPAVTPALVDRIAARSDPLPRDITVDLLDSLAKACWLGKVGHDVYELALPGYAWLLVTCHSEPALATSLARSEPISPLPAARSLALPTERPCALYRWRDQERNLLYVGVTYNVEVRVSGHAANSIWWTFARRQDVEWFPSRAEAEAAERTAIRSESPIFNRAHNIGAEAVQRVTEYLTFKKRLDLLSQGHAA